MEENRLKIIRNEQDGISQGDVAEITGLPLYKIRDAESGKTKISIDIAEAMEEKFGYSFRWVLTGKGPKRHEAPPVPEKMVKRAVNESEWDWFPTGETEPWPNYELPARSLGDSFILVPRYDVKASAGGGAIIHSEQVVDYLAFRSDWVKNTLGIPKENLALISVLGDSMEPTLSEGDLLLIDLRATHIQDNAIYVLSFNSSLLVKRIQQKLDRTVIVKSDNTIYDPEIITPDKLDSLVIVGRVVWYGRRM